jgi:hypothetical protein
MDHSKALKDRFVERYLLNELTAEEKVAFEGHYFACQACAEELRCGEALIENLREVMQQTPADASLPKAVKAGGTLRHKVQFQWLFPVFAAASIVLLLAVVGYQGMVTIPRLQREVSMAVPRPLTSVSLASSVSRGGAVPTVRIGASEPFGLYLDIPPRGEGVGFLCEVRTGSKVEFTVRVSEKQAKDTVHLLIPGDTLKPGQYDLIVRERAGNDSSSTVGSEVIRYLFQVENKQK